MSLERSRTNLADKYFDDRFLEHQIFLESKRQEFVQDEISRLDRLQNLTHGKRDLKAKNKLFSDLLISQFKKQTCETLQQNLTIDELYDVAHELNIDVKNMSKNNFIHFCQQIHNVFKRQEEEMSAFEESLE